MLRNYVIMAVRNMMRDKAFSLINVLGLAVGISCCMLLILYIADETTVDRHHRDVDRLYQVTSIMGEEHENKVMRTTSAPIVWGIKDELPEIENVTRLVNPPGVSQNLIRYGQEQFYVSDGYIADSTLFDMFTYSFLEGDPATALDEANSVVISEGLARRLFGDQSARDKIISINQSGPVADFRITGVLATEQGRSHIKANFFVSMTSSGWAEYLRSPAVTDQWAGQNFLLSYIKLRPGHSAEGFASKMNKVFIKHGADDLKLLGMKKKLGLQPVKDLYLYATYGDRTPRITFLFLIASIAGFILLIACINFMNLSTAKATRRASEVGLRKTLGAGRGLLIKQFLGEATAIVVVAVLVGMVLLQFLLPFFNDLTGNELNLSELSPAFFFLALLTVTVITGLVAGSYPAFYLSSFQPAKVLKGKNLLEQSGNLLRRSLVVFQFAIAITLVCCMMIVSKQLDFMQEQDLGFDADNKLILPLRSEESRSKLSVLRDELRKLSPVKEVTSSSYVPGANILNDFSLYREGSSMEMSVVIKNTWVESNYMDVLDIPLIAGRKFTETRETESQNRIILNEFAVKRLEYTPQEIIGKHLYNDHSNGKSVYEVIGVMKDYHQTSLKEEIYPVLFRVPEDEGSHRHMTLQIAGENFEHTIASIEAIWKSINPGLPFEYTFLDENIEAQYEEDKKVATVITTFTIIAMIISCLGLYGLSSYMAERRVKEIGVRKVMGATITQIVRMMSAEFVKLVLIAFLVSLPVSWYLITQWLENFPYKAPVDPSIFIYAGSCAIIIALITISYESIRAAAGNPVTALRNE